MLVVLDYYFFKKKTFLQDNVMIIKSVQFFLISSLCWNRCNFNRKEDDEMLLLFYK